MDILLSYAPDVIGYTLTAVGASAILAAVLPRHPKLEPAFKLLDLLAANWMQARNAKP